MPNIQLAKNLRTLREMYHLKQTDMGASLNISRQAYSNYENGKRTPDLETLLILSRLFQVTLDELVLTDVKHLSSAHSKYRTPYLAARETDSDHYLYLTGEEMETILKYRSLSPESRTIIDSFLETHAPGYSKKI